MNHPQIHNETQKQYQEIYVIGDISGKINRFLEAVTNMLNLDKHYEEIVFLGDLIADRGENDLEILNGIHLLTEKDQNITLIAGNHERALLDFLTGTITKKFGEEIPDFESYSELIRSSNTHSHNGLNVWSKFGNSPQEMITNIPPEYLEILKTFKLVHKVGNTLFLHAPPSDIVLEILAKYSIEKINREWENILTNLLSENPDRGKLRRYRKLASIFLADNSQIGLENEKYSRVYEKQGTTSIVHGHRDMRKYPLIPGMSFYGYNEKDGRYEAIIENTKTQTNDLLRSQNTF